MTPLRHTMKTCLLTLAFGLGSLITATAGAINDKCPASGKDVDPSKTVNVPVSFCCDDCKEKFDKAPGEYLKMAASAQDGKCPFTGKAAKSSKTSTVPVGVCCGNCEKKVKADPKPFLDKVTPKKG